MNQALWIKLASIAVHAEELLSPDGREIDKQAILSLLQDKEVRAFLDAPVNQVYLPLKRVAGGTGATPPVVPKSSPLAKHTRGRKGHQ